MSQDVRLWGWDKDLGDWVKCIVDPAGKLIIDPTEIFEAVPTENEHGKAPDSSWAFDHKEAPSAHHAKFTAAEARAALSPISIPPAAFFPEIDTYYWRVGSTMLWNRTSLDSQYYCAPVIFPGPVTVTKLTLYGDRTTSLASMTLDLRRINRANTYYAMASVIANWTTGFASAFDDSIGDATVNPSAYAYVLRLRLDPNTAVQDVRFTGAKIDFTG